MLNFKMRQLWLTLAVRIMRLLVGMNLAKEVAPGRYIALPFAAAFVDESPLTAAVIHLFVPSVPSSDSCTNALCFFSTALAEVMAKLPEYFEKSGYKNPGDAYDGPFQYAMNTKLHWFEDLKAKPKEQAAFNTMMRISRVGRGEEWFDFYPIVEKFQKEFTADKDTPLLVDIGGGLGHDLTTFQVKFPDLPGRLILQDLPAAIDDVKEIGPGIEKMKYDFFTPQPVKGARAYYLRTVLHDWPDKQAIKILETIKAAMSKDSLLLVNENTLQEVNVPLYPAELDWTMMAHFASLERAEKQWIQLLDSAGFKVVRVWKPNVVLVGSGTLFEAVPKL